MPKTQAHGTICKLALMKAPALFINWCCAFFLLSRVIHGGITDTWILAYSNPSPTRRFIYAGGRDRDIEIKTRDFTDRH